MTISIQQLPFSVGSSTTADVNLQALIDDYEKDYEKYAADSKMSMGEMKNLTVMLAEIFFTACKEKLMTKKMRQVTNQSAHKYGVEAAEKEYEAALKKFSSEVCKAVGQGISGVAQIGAGCFAFRSGNELGKAQAKAEKSAKAQADARAEQAKADAQAEAKANAREGQAQADARANTQTAQATGKVQTSDAATTPTSKGYERNVGYKMFFIGGGQIAEALFNFYSAIYDKEGAEITRQQRFNDLMRSMEDKTYDELSEIQKSMVDMMASVVQVIQDINANSNSVNTRILTMS